MNRRALLLVLVAMLVLSIVCLTACEEPEGPQGPEDIICVVTSPASAISVDDGENQIKVELADVELIYRNYQGSRLRGKFTVKVSQDSQPACDLQVAFRQYNDILFVSITDNTTGDVAEVQVNINEIAEYIQNLQGDTSTEGVQITDEQLLALEQAFKPILTALEKSTKESVDDLSESVLDAFFNKSKEDKVQRDFSIEKVKAFNDDLYQLPLKKVLIKYLGNGKQKYLDNIKKDVVELLQKPMQDILKDLAKQGITKEVIVDCADQLVQIISAGKIDNAGMLFDENSTMEYLQSEEFLQTKLQDFLIQMQLPLVTVDDVEELYKEMESTFYQLVVSKEDDQLCQDSYEQVNELLDELGKTFDLSVIVRKNRIVKYDVSYNKTDVDMAIPTETGTKSITADISTRIVVDQDAKETSNYDYESICKDLQSATVTEDDILSVNGFVKYSGYYVLYEYNQYPISGYIEKDNVLVDGRIIETQETTAQLFVGLTAQKVCGDHLLVTGYFATEVDYEKSFNGQYTSVDNVGGWYHASDIFRDNSSGLQQYSIYVNPQTKAIYSTTEFTELSNVHNKDNLSYDGTTVKCSSCNISWECDHGDMAVSNVILSNPADCSHGSVVTYQCTSCGFVEQNQSTDHIVVSQEEALNIGSYFDLASITCGKCACGKFTNAKLSTTLNRNFSKSYFIDENGLSHEFETSIYTNNLYVVEETYKKHVGCTVESYKYLTIVLDGEIVLDNYGGLEYIADSHELQVTYQDDNSNCADGYTVVEQCANCDYQNSYWSIGHVVKQEYLFKDKPDCWSGVIIRESCAICSKLGSDIGRKGHVQLPAETITDVNGNGVAVQYCLCGDDITFSFDGHHEISKNISADVAEFIYNLEGSTIKVCDKRQCVSNEENRYRRTVTIYDGDIKKWEKDFDYIVEHDCPDYTQWSDSSAMISCSQGCYVYYRPSMHQYYRDKLVVATQGMDVCSGHEAFFCNCHKCVNSQCKLVQRDAGDLPEKLGLRLDIYAYFYYECPDCGLGFLVQRFGNNYLVDFNINIKDFTSVRAVHVIKDGKVVLYVHESTFEDFKQVTRQ